MILIAIVQDRDGQNWPYIIPTAQLQGRLNISITSHPTKYRGQWADNLHAWQWIDYMVKKNYQQAGQLALPLLQC